MMVYICVGEKLAISRCYIYTFLDGIVLSVDCTEPVITVLSSSSNDSKNSRMTLSVNRHPVDQI